MSRKFAPFLGMALASLFAFSTATQAAAGDKLFERMKEVLAGSVDADAIEMARFSIDRPSEAATVYARAAAQDYPFFALVGAAKVAKGREFGDAGTFTYDSCMTPITAIDSVFGGASAHIDNEAGKADTNAAMATAAQIAAEYAKAQTEEARAQLVAQLSESVPYFGDIPTICAFAFETDLSTERNLNLVADQVSQDIRTAYYAFKSGDVVTGVDALLTLGLGKQVVCTMVDSAVGGGAIGRTPILGTLAKNACAGFVGAVLDGVHGFIKGGVGLVEDGVNAIGSGAQSAACALYSLVASGCSSAEPAPTAFSTAAAWCGPHGGVESLNSKTNQPDDYSLNCNDGSRCDAKPGTAAQCATAMEIAAKDAQEVARAETEFQLKLPQSQAAFDSRWLPRCADEACKVNIRVVRASATQLAQQRHAQTPRGWYAHTGYVAFEAADRLAVSVIEDYDYIVRPPRWAKLFRQRWTAQCEDNQCRAGVQFAALSAQLQVQQKAGQTPRPPYGEMAAIYGDNDNYGAVLVAESVARRVQFNKTTTADAAAAWELITNGIWSKQCSDAPCPPEITQLSAQMRARANELQAAEPDTAPMHIQSKVAGEFNPQFKAAIVASTTRAAANLPPLPASKPRRVGALEPLVQKRPFVLASRTGGRPGAGAAQGRTATSPPMRAGNATPTRAVTTTPAPTPTLQRIPAKPVVSIQPGMDRMGGDYRGFALASADPQLCRQACADDKVCRAYTYVKPGLKGPQAMCFLKNVAPAANADACCTSGEKKVTQ